MKITIEVEHKIGDFVYLTTDQDQLKRVVTSISIYPNNIAYRLACGTSETIHYGLEISKEKNIIL